jgi:putative hemolysin
MARSHHVHMTFSGWAAGAVATLTRRHIRRAEPQPLPVQIPAAYTVKLAGNSQEFRAALRLRYEVFNLELREGLQSSHSSGHDFDQFDAVVDHLIVQCAYTRRVVGTYRLQTGQTASKNIGYYSEREFNFAPYEPLRAQVMELGRACIHQEHRNTEVLMLLWKAIAHYGIQRGCRYLIGCSSLTSQDPAIGAAVYGKLKKFLVPTALQTEPQPSFVCDMSAPAAPDREEAKVPKLLRAYLTIGAHICGPPALDAEFGTIDFLTLLDLARMPKGLFARVTQPQA